MYGNVRSRCLVPRLCAGRRIGIEVQRVKGRKGSLLDYGRLTLFEEVFQGLSVEGCPHSMPCTRQGSELGKRLAICDISDRRCLIRVYLLVLQNKQKTAV